jgi:ATP-dependent Clp protease ATP-binding subunit ClpB
MDKLLNMETYLHERIVGQEEAISALARAIRRSRAGLKSPNRPIGSFVFLGPTGVGKTEVARTLAEFLFGSERALLRFDMSEYMEKHAIAKMIGSPPGYVGHEEGGQLTERIKRKPYSVILLDEIEKAHADVFNVLLQVLDDGRLTDGRGRTVDFKNAILIMTSNLASTYILEHAVEGKEKVRRHVEAELKKAFRPEFLNRLDDWILFDALGPDDILKIVDLQLARLHATLAERRIELEVKDGAKRKLADEGYDPVFGARPLKRAIQRLIQDPLALGILDGSLTPGSRVRADVENGQIAVRPVEVAVH